VLSANLDHVPREEWIARCENGRLLDENHTPLAAEQRVRGRQRLYFLEQAQAEPPVNADIRVLFEDNAILVIDKPAPLPMHACGRFNRNTLQFILHAAYEPERPRPAHRLDANTTGLVVCSRTRHFARLLQPQFENGAVEKRYLVRTLGHPPQDSFVVDACIAEIAGPLGTREPIEFAGLSARTEFRVLVRHDDGTALLEARPRTGRTNQIRVHLWQLGLPVCGDPAYLPDGEIGNAMTLRPDDPSMCLHAWKLKFRHPLTGEDISFEAQIPSWAKEAPMPVP
jgi:RluA family pseudouridine synthase